MPLLIVREMGIERVIEIDRPRITIGTDRKSTLFITDPSAAPLHCVLHRIAQGWFVADLGSSGGTTVNGEPTEKALLEPGDVISAGNAMIHFEFVAEGAPGEAEASKKPWWIRKATTVLISFGVHLVLMCIGAFIVLAATVSKPTNPPPPVLNVRQELPEWDMKKTLERLQIKPPRIEEAVFKPVVTLEEEVDCTSKTPRGTSFHNHANKNLGFAGYIDALGVGGACAGAYGERGRFFGKPLETSEVIFVVDRTGSMSGPTTRRYFDKELKPIRKRKKIDVARRELIIAIDSLPEGTKFAIVCYSHIATRVWPPDNSLVEATVFSKADAFSWVKRSLDTSMAHGGTNTYDAMAIALKMATPPGPDGTKSPTGVYLLTDGVATTVGNKHYVLSMGCNASGEPLTDWEQGEACLRLTKLKILADNPHNAPIYTLGIGMDLAVQHPIKNGSDLGDLANRQCRKFLAEIAKATGGYFRDVPENEVGW